MGQRGRGRAGEARLLSAPPLVGITADFDSGGARAPRSFLYADYTDALRRAGAAPVALTPLPLEAEGPAAIELADALIGRLDGLVLSGGDDMHPHRYGRELVPEVTLLEPRREAFELLLAERALAAGLPTLGVCNGIQTLNVARGGTLVVHIDATRGCAHKAPKPAQAFHPVAASGLLEEVVGAPALRTNSYHHQAVDDPGDGVVVCGRAPDGVIEAVALDGHPFALGVQWHPEKMPTDAHQRRLFTAFVDACRRRARG